MADNLINFTPAKQIIVDDWGKVGGTAFEFTRQIRKRTISEPNWSNRIEEIATAEVSGDSLNGDNIRTGDTLICKVVFDKSEVTEGKLILAKLPCGRTVVKRIYFQGETVFLRSSNGKYADLSYDRDEIEITAIVKSLERKLE